MLRFLRTRAVTKSLEWLIRFHPKGLVVAACVAAIWLLALDVRWGIGAVLAVAVIDAFSFLAPFISRPPRDNRQNPHTL